MSLLDSRSAEKFWLSAISFVGNHIKLRPTEQLVANMLTITNEHMNTFIWNSVNYWFICASASRITLSELKEGDCLVFAAFFVFIRWCDRHFWHLTLLFIADLFANTCCNIELIFDSSLSFTEVEFNLAHPTTTNGGQFQWTTIDLILWAPLVPSGQWLMCDLFLFFLFVTMPTVPKAERTCTLRVLKL